MEFIVILFAVLTIILLSGKGGFLIAGYNTASKKEKEKYNAIKLSRVTGGGMGIITIFLAIRAFFQEELPAFFDWLLPVIIVITVVMILILSNTICKEKNQQPVEQEKSEQIQTSKIIKYSRIFVAVVFVIVGFFLMTGDVKVHLNNDMLYIEGSYWQDHSINYEDIQSITYAKDLDIGDRTCGLGSFKLQEGDFKNGQFGNYILYSYVRCKNYIVIHTNTDMVVINAENDNDTEKLYEELQERLGR